MCCPRIVSLHGEMANQRNHRGPPHVPEHVQRTDTTSLRAQIKELEDRNRQWSEQWESCRRQCQEEYEFRLQVEIKKKKEQWESENSKAPCTECRQKDVQIQQMRSEELLHKTTWYDELQLSQQQLLQAQQEIDSKERELKQWKSEALICPRKDCQAIAQELQKLHVEFSKQPCSKTACATLRARVDSLEKDKSKLQKDNEGLADKAAHASSSLREKLQRKKADCDHLQREIKELQTELGRAKEDHKRAKKNYEETWRKMQEKIGIIQQMENKPCNSRTCQSDYARRTLSVLGSKPHGQTMSEALENLDGKVERVLEQMKLSRASGQSYATVAQGAPARDNEKFQELQRDYQALQRREDVLDKKIDELEAQLHGPRCQRPECVKLRKDLRDKQVAEISKGESIGKQMEKITGGEYGKLIERFEDLTNSPDGLLGLLEETHNRLDAKQMLSSIFKHAYKLSKEKAIEAVTDSLEALFRLDKRAPKEEMEDASRGYGRLIHASGIKAMHPAIVDSLTEQMRSELERSKLGSIFVSMAQQDPSDSILKGVVELAVDFVLLPNPMVLSESEKFTEQTHEREFGYWDSRAGRDAQLIYLRPTVYRSYQGDVACKAWVANSRTLVDVPDTANPHPEPPAGPGGGGLIGAVRGIIGV